MLESDIKAEILENVSITPIEQFPSRLTLSALSAVSTHANRSHGKSKPYDPPANRQAPKSRHQPKVPDGHVSKPAALTKTYDMESEDSEGTDSSNDQRVFGTSAGEYDQEQGGREEKNRVDESDGTESSEDEDEVEDVDEELDYGHRATAAEVKDM